MDQILEQLLSIQFNCVKLCQIVFNKLSHYSHIRIYNNSATQKISKMSSKLAASVVKLDCKTECLFFILSPRMLNSLEIIYEHTGTHSHILIKYTVMRGITGISCSCQGHSLSRATHCKFLWASFVEWTGQLSAATSRPATALPPSLSTLSNNPRDTAVATANVVDVCTNRATTAHNLLRQFHCWLMFLQINCKKTTSITREHQATTVLGNHNMSDKG